MWQGYRGYLACGLELGTQANIPLLQNLGASSFPTMFVCRQQLGKTQEINSILYKEYKSMLFTIIVISYLVLFFWAILQYMLAYSLAILQEQLLRLFLAFLLFFPYCQQWLYATNIVYTLYSQHTMSQLGRLQLTFVVL